MKAHALAEIFPLLEGDEFESLVADIRQYGLRHPIATYDQMILDGRNRFRACAKAKVKPRFEEYTGDDPLAFVISMNLARRHLDESQRGMAAARLATLQWGQRQSGQLAAVPTQVEAAKLLNIGERTVRRAREVLDQGEPELIAAVDQGKLAVSKAASLCNEKKYSKPAQQQIANAVLAGAEPRDAIRAAKKQDYNKTTARARPKPLQGTYRILLGDPPWKYVGLNQADEYGHAERHYDCLSDDELCQYKPGGGSRLVREMMDDNAVLFLWVTSPLLARCFAIIKAWGFEYKASFVWDKVKHTMGHYNSVRHEMLLICTRGSCTPDVPKLVDSVQSIERSGKHSEKPEAFYEIIEGMYDHGRKLELFSRNLRDGWDSEGNEI